jgi:CheY-like chemotaxis protein
MTADDAKTILVAEDERVVRDVICDTLAPKKYTVLSANNGEEALALAGDVSRPIDVLITDIAMDDIDGLELADKLLASRPGIGVLYISGYCEETALGARATGQRRGFLHKPFKPSQLVSKLEDILGG